MTLKKEHPRLYFSREDLPNIRASLQKSPMDSRWDIFLRNADFISGRTIKDMLESYKDTRRITGYAGVCAFAYAVTEDKKYADTAIAMALFAADKSKAYWQNDRETPMHYNKGAALLTAHQSMAFALVYDWCYDAMKKGSTDEGTLNLQNHERRDWWVDNLTTNWSGVVHGGLGTAALAILDEVESAAAIAEYALHYIPRFIRHVISQDGGSDENHVPAIRNCLVHVFPDGRMPQYGSGPGCPGGAEREIGRILDHLYAGVRRALRQL